MPVTTLLGTFTAIHSLGPLKYRLALDLDIMYCALISWRTTRALVISPPPSFYAHAARL